MHYNRHNVSGYVSGYFSGYFFWVLFGVVIGVSVGLFFPSFVGVKIPNCVGIVNGGAKMLTCDGLKVT
ncbi:hypothetical protein J2T61_001144 [Methanocalculus sp. AMF5]|nr:hypothetical protein [Methanocalculus sp. AMF5]